jgi:MFS family permease
VEFADELWSGVAVVAAPSVEREHALGHHGYALVVFALPLLLSAALEAALCVLCDRLPPRRLLGYGLAALSASLGLCALAPGPALLSLGLGLAGAASGLACAAAQTELVRRHAGDTDRALTRWVLFGSLGDLANPLVVALTFRLGGSYRSALAAVALVAAVQAAFALGASPGAGPPPSDVDEGPPFALAWRRAASQRWLWLWLFGAGMCTLLDELVLALATLRLRLDLGASDAAAAGCGLLLSLGSVLGAGLTERWLRRVSSNTVLTVSALACVWAVTFAALAPSPAWLTPALFLLGLCAAPHYALLQARAYAQLPERPGLVNALAQACVVLELCAPAAVGILAERCGLAVAISSLALQPLIVLTLVWVFQRRRQC